MGKSVAGGGDMTSGSLHGISSHGGKRKDSLPAGVCLGLAWSFHVNFMYKPVLERQYTITFTNNL
eukprot:11770528-Ditylum_brightwellii.AAC.1